MIQSSNIIKVAYGDSSSDFDKIFPSRQTLLGAVPKRLTLQTGPNSTKTVELSNNNEYVQYIYRAIAAGLASDSFANQVDGSKYSIHKILTHFIKWLNTCDMSSENCYKLLKLYESKRTNEDNVKPQSSGLRKIISIVKAGIYSASLDQKTVVYIHELLKSTAVSAPDKVNQITLSAFFASMSWLRDVMGEVDYLKLESPKRLIDSFSVTIATTLLFIVEAKKQAQLLLKNPFELQPINVKSQQHIGKSYSRNLLEKLGSIDKDGQLANDLTRLIIADCVPLDRQDDVLSTWISITPGKRKHFPLKTIINGIRCHHYTESHLLAAKHWNKPSTIEQLLFSWLCAVQMIQPGDIGKLKSNDFVIHRNQHSRPVAIQCTYYKGRSGREYEPPVLETSSIEGRAILAYLDYAESSSSALSEAISSIPLSKCPTSIPDRLIRLWSDKTLNSLILEKMVQRKCSPLFLYAYKSMLVASSESYATWCSQNTGGMEGYKQNVARPLPSELFGLAAIKTSAVHARSDKYREGDLINQNSHSNQTEDMHYLTDANKDWINQNGRITRAVLLDIERYVYRPNLNAAIQQAHEKMLLTRLISVLDAGVDNGDEVRINSLGRTELGKSEINEAVIDADSIIVLDTPETVINMLHYINEAERQKDTLIANAMSFFERTILPTVEWMHIVMGRMSPVVVQDGERLYKEIQTLLPPLFSNELRAGISA